MTAYPAERSAATMLAKLFHRVNPPFVFRCMAIGVVIRAFYDLIGFIFIIDFIVSNYSKAYEVPLYLVLWAPVLGMLVYLAFLLPALYGVFITIEKCRTGYVKYICFIAVCLILDFIFRSFSLGEVSEAWAAGFEPSLAKMLIRVIPGLLFLACIIFLYKKIWPYFLKKPVDFAVTDQ